MRALILSLLLLAGPAGAQDSLAAAAEQAARRIEDAAGLLRGAQGADDRLAALTATVRAHEEGLALLRDALRRVAGNGRPSRRSCSPTASGWRGSWARCNPWGARPGRRCCCIRRVRSPRPARA
jgi:hypothetical protein